jgi:hypothetical protein
MLNETHTNRVIVAHEFQEQDLSEIDADAQVTNKPGIALGILSNNRLQTVLNKQPIEDTSRVFLVRKTEGNHFKCSVFLETGQSWNLILIR